MMLQSTASTECLTAPVQSWSGAQASLLPRGCHRLVDRVPYTLCQRRREPIQGTSPGRALAFGVDRDLATFDRKDAVERVGDLLDVVFVRDRDRHGRFRDPEDRPLVRIAAESTSLRCAARCCCPRQADPAAAMLRGAADGIVSLSSSVALIADWLYGRSLELRSGAACDASCARAISGIGWPLHLASREDAMLSSFQNTLFKDLKAPTSYGEPLVGWDSGAEIFRRAGAPPFPSSVAADLANTFIQRTYFLLRTTRPVAVYRGYETEGLKAPFGTGHPSFRLGLVARRMPGKPDGMWWTPARPALAIDNLGVSDIHRIEPRARRDYEGMEPPGLLDRG